MAKPTWKDYFTFSKSERISVYILLAVLTASIIIPYFYKRSFTNPAVDPVLQEQLTAVLEAGAADSSAHTITNNAAQETIAPATAILFYFDPNTLTAAGFRQLGLRDKTIRTIINYRSKGGYFEQAEDIRKIYGLNKEEADRLIPYIRVKKARENYSMHTPVSDSTPSPRKIDINTATEEDFKALPGIGDVLSKRIIKFRNSIHGFHAVDDIKRTYGLPDSTFRRILPWLTISGDK